MPFFLIASLLFGDRALGFLMFLCRFIGWGLGILSCIRYRRHYHPEALTGGPYVYVANHRSNMDAPVAAIATRGRVRYLAKKELLKVPLMGLVFRVTTVNVDRSSKESRKQSMVDLMQYIRTGDSIFIFPEGTRNKDREKNFIAFKDGAFTIAIQTKTPIQPMLFLHTDDIMTNSPVLMRPGVIDVHYLKPIFMDTFGENDVQALKAHVGSVMESEYMRLMHKG